MNVVDANENRPLRSGKRRAACKNERDVQSTGVAELSDWSWRNVGFIVVLDMLSLRGSCFLDVRHGGIGSRGDILGGRKERKDEGGETAR